MLKLRAAPAAQAVLDAIEVVRGMNSDSARKVPTDAPTAFIKPRWKPLVITEAGIDRRFYEICALAELKNSLRSGDIWVQGSRQFKDFEDYLLPADQFGVLKQANELSIAVSTDCDQYLHDRLTLLHSPFSVTTPIRSRFRDSLCTLVHLLSWEAMWLSLRSSSVRCAAPWALWH